MTVSPWSMDTAHGTQTMPEIDGALLICGICGTPLLVGIWLGWMLRGRINRHGLPGAGLVDWIKSLFGREII